MNRWTSTAVLALALSVGPRVATAEDDTTQVVAELNEAGARYYSQRDYRKAIEKFIQAYAVDADPNLLFNIARCYEGLGETEAAIEKYEAYLQTPGADAQGRKRARESLRLLREPASSASQPEAAAPESPRAQVSAATPVQAGEDSHVGRWLALASGVVSAGAGLTFYLMGSSDHGQITDAEGFGDSDGIVNMTRGEAQDLKDSGDTKKLVGAIGLGLGGALLGTYAVIVLSDGASTEQSPADSAVGLERIQLGLAPATDGGMFSLSGRF